jgi:hypothetical protein
MYVIFVQKEFVINVHIINLIRIMTIFQVQFLSILKLESILTVVKGCTLAMTIYTLIISDSHQLKVRYW